MTKSFKNNLTIQARALEKDFALNKYKYLMILPVMAYLILFCYKPMYGVIIAFQRFRPGLGIAGSTWVGLDNFARFFKDVNFWKVLRNTFSISFLNILFTFPAPILLALLLNEVKCSWFKRTVQTVSYLPHFIAMVVVCGLINQFCQSDGLINDIIAFFGGERANLMIQQDMFYPIYIISGIWKEIGWSSIIYLAAFSYISPIAGKRESRRLMGDYILTESDVIEQKDFPDTIGHGGWSIDLHALDGFYSKEIINRHIFLKGIYQIPYRCCYSKDVPNLFIEGRCMSVSHVALGTVRTMATLSTAGQANAVAAFLCRKYGISPRAVGEEHLEELQNLLLKADQYIVGKQYSAEENLVQKAEVTVSSVKPLSNLTRELYRPLEENMALSIPLSGKVHGISFYGKVMQDTILCYRVYSADKPENYNPANEVTCGCVPVCRAETVGRISIPLDLELAPGHYFIELERNQALELAMSKYSYTGAVTSVKKENHDESHVDYMTGQKKDYEWKVEENGLCFEADCESALFGAENLTNGYTRPYLLTNLWHSMGKDGEWVMLHWKEPQTLSKLVLYFDSNLNRFCKQSDPDNVDLFYRMVKDYAVSYVDKDGNSHKLCEVTGNFQRVNALCFEPVVTDTILIELKATHGQGFFSIYEIRGY